MIGAELAIVIIMMANGTATPMLQILRPIPSRPDPCHLRLPCNHLAECPVLRPASSGPSQASPLWYTELANRKHSKQLSVC